MSGGCCVCRTEELCKSEDSSILDPIKADLVTYSAVDITPPQHETLDPSAPTVVVAHGLTGGSHESYVRNVLEWVVRPKEQGGLGGRGVVANVSIRRTFKSQVLTRHPHSTERVLALL